MWVLAKKQYRVKITLIDTNLLYLYGFFKTSFKRANNQNG